MDGIFVYQRVLLHGFCTYTDGYLSEQTDAFAAPRPIPDLAPGTKPVETMQRLFDFLALRGNMHQKVGTSVNYKVEVLSPMRDFDQTMQTIAVGLDFEEALQTAKDWLNGKRKSGEIVIKDEIGVFAKNNGDKRNPRYSTDGIMRFRNNHVSDDPLGDRSDVILDGKRLTVRKS